MIAMRSLRIGVATVLTALLPTTAALAGETDASPPTIDGADTAFLLACAGLLMLMTPALGLFYGGMVRRKNVLATFMHSFIMLGVVSLQWILVGYSLAFGPSVGGLIGGLDWIGLRGVGLDPHPTYAPTVPQQLHMGYQLMFAIVGVLIYGQLMAILPTATVLLIAAGVMAACALIDFVSPSFIFPLNRKK